jgi:UDP-glucose 4-epimerase
VLGDRNSGGAFTAASLPGPKDAYAFSKLKAEEALWSIRERTRLELVVVRPPLVYGAGVKGNFRRLLNLIRSGLPLPFGAIHNRRSFIGIDNLSDLVLLCATHPAASARVFLAADGNDLSTPELVRLLIALRGRGGRVSSFPLPAMSLLARCLRMHGEWVRLTSDLAVDSSEAREVLGWSPRVDLPTGMQRMVRWYVDEVET